MYFNQACYIKQWLRIFQTSSCLHPLVLHRPIILSSPLWNAFLLPLLALFCLDRGSTAARFEACYVRFQFGSTSPDGQSSPKHGRCMQNELLGHTGNGGCEEMLTDSCTRCEQQRRWGKAKGSGNGTYVSCIAEHIKLYYLCSCVWHLEKQQVKQRVLFVIYCLSVCSKNIEIIWKL